MAVAAFSGWRVSVFSFEYGGRTYSIGPNGTVIAGDSARSRFELRVSDRSSEDAVGNDTDRVEFSLWRLQQPHRSQVLSHFGADDMAHSVAY